MVRSYYPSECHADYFDFERIEALKPAIDGRRHMCITDRSKSSVDQPCSLSILPPAYSLYKCTSDD
ncbi:hypothetical protein NGUA05_04222 [Salmonella enterica]|nr:hypothetical protein NGUA05_04222 [Salmonella enterica]